MPFVPEEQHGKLVIFGAAVLRRPRRRGRGGACAPFRGAAPTPHRRHGPADAVPGDVPAGGPGLPPAARSRTLLHRPRRRRDGAETIMERLEALDAPMRAAQLRVLGGAMARVPADATAFAHRDSRDHGQRRGVLRRRPTTRPAKRGLGRPSSRPRSASGRPARTSTSSATRARRGSAPPTRGATWDRLGRDQAALRPGQPVPPATRTSRRRGPMSERKPSAAKLLVKPGDLVWVSDPARGRPARAAARRRAPRGRRPGSTRRRGRCRVRRRRGGVPGRRSTPTRPR